MEQFTRDSGLIILGMELEPRSGQMDPSTMVFGVRIKPTVKESLFMLMAMFMKASGLTTKLTAKALTLTQTALTIMAIGSMISNMVTEWNRGLTVPSTKVTT